jgi:hypothetical protein
MLDEVEEARLEMIRGGLEEENILRISQCGFDLYTRSGVEAHDRIEKYRSVLVKLAPYVDFRFDEEDIVEFDSSEEEKRKQFLDTFRGIDWNEVGNQLPAIEDSKLQ